MERKPRNYWTIERILEKASLCVSREDFRVKFENASMAARRLGILDDLFPTLHRKKGYWNETMIRLHAKECSSKEEFSIKYAQGYRNALKLNIINDLGFPVLGNLYKRCIYSIEFENNHVYVGLTCNFRKRINNHVAKNSHSTVYKYIINNPEIKYKIIKLTDYINKEEAVIKEEEILQRYKNENWNILNIAKTGGLGGFISKRYTDEELLVIASKYRNRKEIQASSDKYVYHYLSQRGLLKLTNFTSNKINNKLSEESIQFIRIAALERFKLKAIKMKEKEYAE